MPKRFLALIIVPILVFSACGMNSIGSNQSKLDEIVKKYSEAQTISTNLNIISDLGERTLEYDVQYEYNKDGTHTVEILKPDELAGIKVNFQDGDELVLSYEDTTFEAGMQDIKGITPADVMPYLIKDIINQYAQEYWEVDQGNTKLIAERLENDDIAKEVYFLDDGSLAYAEIFKDGTCMLKLSFKDFKINGD